MSEFDYANLEKRLPFELSNYLELLMFMRWLVMLKYDHEQQVYVLSAQRIVVADIFWLTIDYSSVHGVLKAKISTDRPVAETDVKNDLINLILKSDVELREMFA